MAVFEDDELSAFGVGGGGFACFGVDGDEALLAGLGVDDGVGDKVGAVVFCGGGGGLYEVMEDGGECGEG